MVPAISLSIHHICRPQLVSSAQPSQCQSDTLRRLRAPSYTLRCQYEYPLSIPFIFTRHRAGVCVMREWNEVV